MAGKINPRVHMRAGSEWVDITSDVRTSEDITINRGRRDEGASVDPTTCSLLLNNRHGKYSPRHPGSPYYGLIGRNTPIRVRVGTPPPAPSPVLVDSFDRTVADGWGSADSGQAWVVDAGDVADFSVDGGVGTITVDAVSAIRRVTLDAGLADLDLTVRIRTDTAPVGEAYRGIQAGVYVRWDPDTNEGLFFGVTIGTDTGRPDGGLRVSTSILTPASTPAPEEVAPGVTAQAGGWLRLRVLATGPEVRMRVWPDGAEEPEVWHAQGYTTGYLAAGDVAVGGGITALDTPVPALLEFSDLEVREPTPPDIRTRMVGEVSEWPMRWDLSGNDVWVPITASGILRRLSQGSAAAPSALAATIPAHQPLAYWPLEDGPDAGLSAASGLEGGQPLRVQGLTFAEEDGPPGSGPLPVVTGVRGGFVSPAIEMTDTGVWEVDLLYYLAEDDFPEGVDQEMLSVASSGRAVRWRVSLGTGTTSGDLLIVLQAFDEDDAVLDSSAVDVQGTGVAFLDVWRQLRLNVREDGGDVYWTLFWVDEDGAGGGTTGTFSGSPGRVASISTTFGTELVGALAFGHLSVWGAPTTRGYFGAVAGFPGETARQRISRTSAQAGVPMVVSGEAATRMGAQPAASYLDVLTECADADGGILSEQRAALGLAYRGRDTLYNRGRTEGVGE
ncbi:hypothetical protein [Streptomonospora wellingtoniae]|uniref:Minor tail protein n=1 Tax=Streptomonospora wellingtoniae TaxID=3075544 RepID=A0ABU2L0J2_9ACTN|nr:hypothetical protein [Streptomonospora sp. DSM 45055]MDT0305058.1 hypothetical protein [Streptomonospora sp. DSM 45055]